jgi:hypothetical protein
MIPKNEEKDMIFQWEKNYPLTVTDIAGENKYF